EPAAIECFSSGEMLPPLGFDAKLPVTTQAIATLPHRTRASASKTPSAAGRLHDPPPSTPVASTSKSFIAPTTQTRGSPTCALGSGPSKLRPPPHLRDPHAGDFHRASACDHALGLCSCHPGADEINQEIEREPMREHDRLAAAVGGCGEQFEGAAAL